MNLLALAAIEWVAQKAPNIGNAEIMQLLPYPRIWSATPKGFSPMEKLISRQLHNDPECVKADAVSAVSAVEKDLDDFPKGLLNVAFDDAKSVPDKFVDGFEEALSDVRTAVNSIEQAAEVLAYNLAMTALEVGKKQLKDLDPHRLG